MASPKLDMKLWEPVTAAENSVPWDAIRNLSPPSCIQDSFEFFDPLVVPDNTNEMDELFKIRFYSEGDKIRVKFCVPILPCNEGDVHRHKKHVSGALLVKICVFLTKKEIEPIPMTYYEKIKSTQEIDLNRGESRNLISMSKATAYCFTVRLEVC